MAFRIPEDQYDIVRSLYGLAIKEWQTIVNAVEESDYDANPSVFMDQAAERLARAGFQDVRQIINVLITFSQIRISNRLSVKDFLEDLEEASNRTGEDGIVASSLDWSQITAPLSQILAEDSPLTQTTKLADIQWDRPNLLDSIRIMSDLRPAFRVAAEDGISQFVSLHTLKVQYRTMTGVHESFFSMDARDLRKIREEIDRALDKEREMASFLDEKGFRTWVIDDG
jgi:hypothetical protein